MGSTVKFYCSYTYNRNPQLLKDRICFFLFVILVTLNGLGKTIKAFECWSYLTNWYLRMVSNISKSFNEIYRSSLRIFS